MKVIQYLEEKLETIYSCAETCTDCFIYSRSQKKKVKKKSENDVNFKLFL